MLSAQSAEDTKFKKFQDTFWDAYFKFFPTTGTIEGYSKYRDKVEDFSSSAVEKFHDALDGFNQELVSKIDKSKLSPENRIDCDMMLDFLDLEFMKFENLLPWEYNPLFYNEIFVESIRSLLAGTPQAPDALNSATSRAKSLPGLIKKAKDLLKTPPEAYTREAIQQMPGIIDYYRTEAPKFCGSATGLQTELAKVATALEDYRNFLQNQLLPRSTGNFRLAEAHLRTLRMKSQGILSIGQEVVARSQADYNNIRREMLLVCIPFFKLMYPQIDIEQLGQSKGEEGTRQVIIQGVIDKLKSDHTGRNEYIAAISASADKIRKFIQDKDLAPIPPETLKIEPMPPYLPAKTWTLLEGPGAFEPPGNYTIFVKQIPADWPQEQADSLLEEYNTFYLDFMTAQKIFPGTFVPSVLARKNASPTRKMTGNAALIKGWPIYINEKLIMAGYNGYDLKTRLSQLKLQLKNVILFQLDMNVHEGSYTKGKTIEVMTVNGFMTPAEAEKEWTRILLNPGDASLAYIGYQEIKDLEKDYINLKGQAFSSKDFLSKLLDFGPLPLRVLKTKLAN